MPDMKRIAHLLTLKWEVEYFTNEDAAICLSAGVAVDHQYHCAHKRDVARMDEGVYNAGKITPAQRVAIETFEYQRDASEWWRTRAQRGPSIWRG